MTAVKSVTGLCHWWHFSFYYSQTHVYFFIFYCMKGYCQEDKLYLLEENNKMNSLCPWLCVFALASRSDTLCFKSGLFYFSSCPGLSCNNPGDTYKISWFFRYWVIYDLYVSYYWMPPSLKNRHQLSAEVKQLAASHMAVPCQTASVFKGRLSDSKETNWLSHVELSQLPSKSKNIVRLV